MKNLVWPDYENCIANLPNSILKKFGVETVGKTLPLLDGHLKKDYRNIVVLLLDGMGRCIVDKLLDADGPFRTHLAGTYNSVFLSTTVAATTSVLSGLQPCEHSWLGWECYYPQINENVTVFTNCIQSTEKQAADFNVARTFTPYEDVIAKLNRAGHKAYLVAPFIPPHPQEFTEIVDAVKLHCKEPGSKYIYAYWPQPDGLLHRRGSDAAEVKEDLLRIERQVSEIVSELEDTLLIITADHGHIDNDFVVLQDYPIICDCLERMPSLEPRVLNFFVKKGMEQTFEAEFNSAFGNRFLLMSMEEAFARKLFGTGKEHECFRGMLGNYLAIATDNLSIFFNDERWKSMHGSVTEEEMRIPLILFET